MVTIQKEKDKKLRIVTPNIFKPDTSGIPLGKCFTWSVIGHLSVMFWSFLIAKILLVLIFFFGFKIPFLEKPEVKKPPDIHFVLKKPIKPRMRVAKRTVMPNPGGKKGGTSRKITSKKPHSGSSLPVQTNPDEFSIPVSKVGPLTSDVGIGTHGTPGISSPGGGTGDGDGSGYGRRRDGGLKKSQIVSDMLEDPDLTPYINDLQRRIKWNWKPPKGNEDEKVVLFLRIAKDGKLLILNIKNTSLNADADNAATAAVKKLVPLPPLPAGYQQNYLDVVFTFDYNVGSVRGRF